MKGNKKRIIYLSSGMGAGLAAFSVIELFSAAGFTSYLALSLAQGASLGFIFGFVFGFADGILYKELKSGLTKALIAAGIGALTAAAAQLATSQGMLWSAGFFKLEQNHIMGILFPLWRGIGWMLMGAAIGAVDGIHQKTLRRTIAGFLGGLTGGLVGGLIFEFIVRYIPEASFAGALGLCLMGILIGLFISEFERRFSYARLRVLNGQLKDREFLLVKQKLRIGGALHDDIYLHGYKNISSLLISGQNNDVYIESEDGRVLLNDQTVTEKQSLKYQDVIQIGDVKLLYMPL